MIVDYPKLAYWMSENLLDPAHLKKELNLEKDTFSKMRHAEEVDEQVVELICKRLGCSIDDVRYIR